MTRHNTPCPFCKHHTATFFAASRPGHALYRCVNVFSRAQNATSFIVVRKNRPSYNVCGRTFEGPAPKPLKRETFILEQERAA